MCRTARQVRRVPQGFDLVYKLLHWVQVCITMFTAIQELRETDGMHASHAVTILSPHIYSSPMDHMKLGVYYFDCLE